MTRTSKPFLILALVAVIVGLTRGTTPVVAQSSCAEFISGGPTTPARGRLVGYTLVTVTLGAAPGGIGGSISYSFNVGHYDMGDGGEPTSLRCDTYTLWIF